MMGSVTFGILTTNSFRLHLNSLAPDLEYSMSKITHFLDINIHPDNSTSIYRKPTHKSLTHYSSAATLSSKESVVRTLTRRAFKLCSSKLAMNSSISKPPSFPTVTLFRDTPPHAEDLGTPSVPPLDPEQSQLAQSNLLAAVPYSQSYASSIRKSLAKYDITMHSVPPAPLNLSSRTPSLQHRQISWRMSSTDSLYDCDDFYIGQTCRPLIKRIKEHEACQRLNNYTDSATGNIKSAPAKHAHDHGHNIDWNGTQ